MPFLYNAHGIEMAARTYFDKNAGELDVLESATLIGMLKGRPGPRANRELVHTFLRETPEYLSARDGALSDDQALKKLQADTAFIHALWQRKTRLESGFLAIDPGNGHVRAWVGSRDFEQEKFDHVQQARRQPGSTFKPFVYGAAFDQGIDPLEMLIDQPVEIQVDARTVWSPEDVQPPSMRPMSLRDGLIHSKNTITAQVIQRIGPSLVARVAYDMGVRHSKLDQVPSLALGTSPVTLKEMATAFGSIANGGNYVEPVLVTRVEDRHGTVLQEFRVRPPEPALSHEAAQTLLDAMRGVIDKGGRLLPAIAEGEGDRSQHALYGAAPAGRAGPLVWARQ